MGDDAARDPRVAFAAERTLLAWVRTGLAMMGFGFVVARFGLFLRQLAAMEHAATPVVPGPSAWIGTSLVLLGALVNVLAAIRHARFLRRFERGQADAREGSYLSVLVAMMLAALGLGLAYYLLRPMLVP